VEVFYISRMIDGDIGWGRKRDLHIVFIYL